MAMCNYYWLQQEPYQFLQDYRDKFYANKQVCEQIGIKMGVTDKGTISILKLMDITNPTEQPKLETEKECY